MLILQCSSLAELYLKDYEAELYTQGFQTKFLTKKRIKDNAKQAESLRLQLITLEQDLTVKTNDIQKDGFLEDVGFLHNIITLINDRCGNNDEKREKVLKYLSEMESELKLKIL